MCGRQSADIMERRTSHRSPIAVFDKGRFVSHTRLVVAVLTLSVAVLSTACETNESPFSPSLGGSLRLDDFVSSASIGGSSGRLLDGFAPSPSGGLVIDVSGNRTIVNGGSSTLMVTAPAAFTTVYVSIAGSSLGIVSEAHSGIGEFYEVVLPAAGTSAALLLAFSQDIPTSPFDLFFAVVDTNGTVGPFSAVTFNVIRVGTGDVQVTLSWDTDSDVDLHVVDPSGEEIFYGNRESASGGMLDLDSNAACTIDGVQNENITWSIGAAPQGTYIVRVDYWSSCGVPRTNYTVVINNGGDTQIVNGTFTGAGDRGGLGAGVEVARFVRATGPAARPARQQTAPANKKP